MYHRERNGGSHPQCPGHSAPPHPGTKQAEQQDDIRIFADDQRLFPGGPGAVNVCARDP